MNKNILVSTLLLYACCMALLSCSNTKAAMFKNEQGQYQYEVGSKTYLLPYHYAGGDGVFADGQAVAVLDGKWGRIDEQGNTVHPFVYDWISEKGEAGFADQYLVKVGHVDPERKFYLSGGQTGIINERGEVVLPPSYVAIYPAVTFGLMMVNDGTSVDLANDSVHFDGLYGYINKTGQIVIPCEYEEASPAFDEDGTVWVRKSGRWGKIDTLGSVKEPFVHDHIEH